MNQHCRLFLLGVPLLAILAGWYATTTLCAERAPIADQVRWVRTADGWEKAWWQRKPTSTVKPLVHPALMAVLMLVGSIGLLTIGRCSRPGVSYSACLLEIAPEDRL